MAAVNTIFDELELRSETGPPSINIGNSQYLNVLLAKIVNTNKTKETTIRHEPETNVVSNPEDFPVEAWKQTLQTLDGLLPFHLVEEDLLLATQPSKPRERFFGELIQGLRDNTFFDQLTQRLKDLKETSEEEWPDQEPMSISSLSDFISFIRSNCDVVFPEIVLSNEGNICAQWTRSRNEHFVIEFMGKDDVRYVVFAPNPDKPYRTNRNSGQTTVDFVMKL